MKEIPNATRYMSIHNAAHGIQANTTTKPLVACPPAPPPQKTQRPVQAQFPKWPPLKHGAYHYSVYVFAADEGARSLCMPFANDGKAIPQK